MQRLSEKTPLVPGRLQATSAGRESPSPSSPQVWCFGVCVPEPGEASTTAPSYSCLLARWHRDKAPCRLLRDAFRLQPMSVASWGYVGKRGVVRARFSAGCIERRVLQG